MWHVISFSHLDATREFNFLKGRSTYKIVYYLSLPEWHTAQSSVMCPKPLASLMALLWSLFLKTRELRTLSGNQTFEGSPSLNRPWWTLENQTLGTMHIFLFQTTHAFSERQFHWIAFPLNFFKNLFFFSKGPFVVLLEYFFFFFKAVDNCPATAAGVCSHYFGLHHMSLT